MLQPSRDTWTKCSCFISNWICPILAIAPLLPHTSFPNCYMEISQMSYRNQRASHHCVSVKCAAPQQEAWLAPIEQQWSAGIALLPSIHTIYSLPHPLFLILPGIDLRASLSSIFQPPESKDCSLITPSVLKCTGEKSCPLFLQHGNTAAGSPLTTKQTLI